MVWWRLRCELIMKKQWIGFILVILLFIGADVLVSIVARTLSGSFDPIGQLRRGLFVRIVYYSFVLKEAFKSVMSEEQRQKHKALIDFLEYNPFILFFILFMLFY